MLFVLIIFISLRYHTGWDYFWYYNEIVNIVTRGHTERELGVVWTYIFSLGKLTGLYWLPISIVGMMTIILIYNSLKKVFKKNDDSIKTALLFFAFYPEFYLATFSTIRQWLALSLCIFVFCIFISKKQHKLLYLLLFISTVLFTTFFLHSSSAVCFSFILVFYITKLIKKIWFISILFTILLSVFFYSLSFFCTKLLPRI